MNAKTARWTRLWQSTPVVLALMSVVFFAYGPGLQGGYVFDDFSSIVENSRAHLVSADLDAVLAAAFSSPASDLQRPLATLTFALNHYFTGLDPFPMKLTNLIVHAINTVLVLGIASLVLSGRTASLSPPPFLDSRLVAALVALAWGVNPINLTAVLYVVQRMESLAHLFVFAGLWLYLAGRNRMQEGHGGWFQVIAGILILPGVGVLAKESAALAPLYCLAAEILLFGARAPSGKDTRRLRWLFAVLCLVGLVVALALLAPALQHSAFGGRDFTMLERLLSEPRAILQYLRWTLVPDIGAMGLFHDDFASSRGLFTPWSTLPALVGLIGLALAAVVLQRRRPIVSLGIAWFLTAHVLTGSFLPLELMFEHRNYFASFGLLLALADGLAWSADTATRARKWIFTLAILLLVTYTSVTWLRALDWSNPLTLARAEASRHPGSPRAAYELARILVERSIVTKDPRVGDEARRAIARAVNVPGSSALPVAVGLVFDSVSSGSNRRPQEAQDPRWSLMETRVATQAGLQTNMAIRHLVNCSVRGDCDFPEARVLAVLDRALSHTENAELLTAGANYAFNVQRDFRLGLGLMERAKQAEPGNPQYRINLARARIALGDLRGAESEILGLEGLGRTRVSRRDLQRLRQELEIKAREEITESPG